MPINDENANNRKQSLLRKYDLLVDCLSFEHVDKCSNVKELEKIIRVLRSGEEGYYPHLESAAEAKLQKLSPNNHLLRVAIPVTPTSALDPEERQQVSSDIQAWSNEMLSRESILKSTEPVSIEVPAVRNSSVSKVVNENSKMKSSSAKTKDKPVRKCLPNDYTFWDKFDADSEVLKLELEEERQAEKEAVERKKKEDYQKFKVKQLKQDEEVRETNLYDAAGAGDRASLPEREFDALQEKNKGNEYFRNQDLSKALNHYSRSILFLPSVDAYNNRAQTYLKLNNFSAALKDCEEVMKLDPMNTKAYYRRGVALFSLDKFQDALEDFEKVLKIEPNDKNTQEYAKKTYRKLGIAGSSKSVHMTIETKASHAVNVDEDNNADSADKYYPFFNINPNDDISLNEIGTARVMCRCSGTPGFMKKVRSLDDIKNHGRVCLRRNSHSQKRTVSQAIDTSSGDLRTGVESNNKVVITKRVAEVSGKPDEDKSLKNKFRDKKSEKSVTSNASFISQSNEDALSNFENSKTPYLFSVFWSSIKGVDDLPIVAKALRILCPDLISQVIGNKLEAKMLTLFILALREHFVLPDEWGVVQRYLLSFTQLPRFNIVKMMLDKTTMKELELLLNNAESQGLRVLDLLQLYGFTSCP